jgi:hypothetical protein
VSKIMAQEVVPDRVLDTIERRFEPVQAFVKVPVPAMERSFCAVSDRRKSERLGRPRVDLEIDRETPIKEGTMAVSDVNLVN